MARYTLGVILTYTLLPRGRDTAVHLEQNNMGPPWSGACRRVYLPNALVPGWTRLAVQIYSELVVLPVGNVARQRGDIKGDNGHLPQKRKKRGCE